MLFVCLFTLYWVSLCVVLTMTCTTNKRIIVIPWAVKDVTVGKAPPFPYSPLHRSGLDVYNDCASFCILLNTYALWCLYLNLYMHLQLHLKVHHLISNETCTQVAFIHIFIVIVIVIISVINFIIIVYVSIINIILRCDKLVELREMVERQKELSQADGRWNINFELDLESVQNLNFKYRKCSRLFPWEKLQDNKTREIMWLRKWAQSSLEL